MDQLGEDKQEVTMQLGRRRTSKNPKFQGGNAVPVQQFLEGIKEALGIGSAVDTMTILKMKSSKQTALHSYCHSLANHTPHGLQD